MSYWSTSFLCQFFVTIYNNFVVIWIIMLSFFKHRTVHFCSERFHSLNVFCSAVFLGLFKFIFFHVDVFVATIK